MSTPILIAEDDFTSRSILAVLLKESGYEIVETVNGTQAWDIMAKPEAPRMAILDWMMPEMTGLEVCRKVRELNAAEPPYLIMLTAKGEKTDIITALGAGADDYLTKPFDPEELQARVAVGRRLLETQQRLIEKVKELSQAHEHIEALEGILPICSYCKKIRNDEDSWSDVEEYVSKHSKAEFSHGICPGCLKTNYPEIYYKQFEKGA